jgi:hypothetical protein
VWIIEYIYQVVAQCLTPTSHCLKYGLLIFLTNLCKIWNNEWSYTLYLTLFGYSKTSPNFPWLRPVISYPPLLNNSKIKSSYRARSGKSCQVLIRHLLNAWGLWWDLMHLCSSIIMLLSLSFTSLSVPLLHPLLQYSKSLFPSTYMLFLLRVKV